ncbi:hypothetical protein KCP74_11545 [Salmonella enterica subsp. enterica]|nr:hypothetical protein KCP74_11545 [Salmonella enterica subsp. enterica]
MTGRPCWSTSNTGCQTLRLTFPASAAPPSGADATRASGWVKTTAGDAPRSHHAAANYRLPIFCSSIFIISTCRSLRNIGTVIVQFHYAGGAGFSDNCRSCRRFDPLNARAAIVYRGAGATPQDAPPPSPVDHLFACATSSIPSALITRARLVHGWRSVLINSGCS